MCLPRDKRAQKSTNKESGAFRVPERTGEAHDRRPGNVPRDGRRVPRPEKKEEMD